MANEFKMEIPIDLTGINNTKSADRETTQIVRQQEKMTSQLSKIAVGVGISAMIWKALDPILSPLIKLMTMIFTVLFMPLIGLLKPLMGGMAEGIKDISKAQKDVRDNDGSALDQFTAGFGVFATTPALWAPIGGLIAMGFIGSLGTKAVLGAILGTLSLGLIWDTITNADSLEEALLGAGWAGLTSGIAGWILTGSTEGLLLGLAVFSATMGLKLLWDGLQEEDPILSAVKLVFGSLGVGTATGLAWAFIQKAFLGATIAEATVVGSQVIFPVSALVFSWSVWNKLDLTRRIPNALQELFTGGNPLQGLFNTDEAYKEYWDKRVFNTMAQDLKVGLSEPVQLENEKMFGRTMHSYPLGWALSNAELYVKEFTKNSSLQIKVFSGDTQNEWRTMAETSVLQINNIIENLNRIPRRIVTIHEIKTIRT